MPTQNAGTERTYLVGLVRSGGSSLALLSGSEFSQVSVVITLPVDNQKQLTNVQPHREYGTLTSYGRKPWIRQSQPLG